MHTDVTFELHHAVKCSRLQQLPRHTAQVAGVWFACVYMCIRQFGLGKFNLGVPMAHFLFLSLSRMAVFALPAFDKLVETAAVVPTPPNSSSIVGLTIAGYQGWFATPNDDNNNGWIHWGPLKAGTGIEEDFWPEMMEFSVQEKHVAPGYTNADGSAAELFSSDNRATVTRHFQWMEAYGKNHQSLK